MRNARRFADAPAFDRNSPADRRKRGRLHPERLLEINNRPAEQQRQLEVRLAEPVDAGIMRAVSGIGPYMRISGSEDFDKIILEMCGNQSPTCSSRGTDHVRRWTK
jgi:hypothetical protein